MPGLIKPVGEVWPVEEVWRREAPHVLAALLRRGATLADCEDAAQEALLAAAQQWPADGVPGNPRGWLIRVASRRLIDQTRADAARVRREERDAHERAVSWSDRATDTDDSLQLLLLCCHPVLGAGSAVALTLRAVGGLSTRQIAAGLLLPEATAAQRISRAKATLKAAGARFDHLDAGELPQRLHRVRHVLHLMFTTGAHLPAGEQLLDHGLAGEAIRLTEDLHRAMPRDPETSGLLALMLLVESRAPARVRGGDLVPLAEQDRQLWDQHLIRRGIELIEDALPRGPVGPFQLQAAIQAVHAEAASMAETDWPQILQLYDMLGAIAPSPAVELGTIVAVAETTGAPAALDRLEPLVRQRPKDHHALAVRAHLLQRLGHRDAATAYRLAAALTDSIPEQRYLTQRAQHLAGHPRPHTSEPTRDPAQDGRSGSAKATS